MSKIVGIDLGTKLELRIMNQELRDGGEMSS